MTYPISQVQSYVSEYSNRYTLDSLIRQRTSQEDSAYHSKTAVELFLSGAKEGALHLPFVVAQTTALNKMLRMIPAYARWHNKFRKRFSDATRNWSSTRLLFTCGIVVPAMEELIFRGIIQNGLSRVQPNDSYYAALTTHLLFAISHLSPQTLAICMFNARETKLYEETGSIWPSLGSHITHNSVLFLCGIFKAKIRG